MALLQWICNPLAKETRRIANPLERAFVIFHSSFVIFI